MGTACPAVPVVFDAAKLIDFQVRCKHKTDNVLLISDMAGIHLDKPSYTGAGERTERTAVAPLKQQKTLFTQNTRTTDHPETSMTDCNHSTTGRMTVTASILASREAYCGGCRSQTAGCHRTPSHVADSHTLIQAEIFSHKKRCIFQQ